MSDFEIDLIAEVWPRSTGSTTPYTRTVHVFIRHLRQKLLIRCCVCFDPIQVIIFLRSVRVQDIALPFSPRSSHPPAG